MKICVIQLGAKGTVVRTLSVLPALKERYSEAEIYWITRDNVKDVFLNNPYVKEVFTTPYNESKRYNILYNFDTDNEAMELAKKIDAERKYGFYSEGGYPAAFNRGAEYYLNTIFDDDLKRENRKTFQELIFEIAEMPYNKEHCAIYLNEVEIKYGKDFAKQNKIRLDRLIGIHIGASSKWPSKAWDIERIKDFVVLANKKGYDVIVFSGPDDSKQIEKLKNDLKKDNVEVYYNNPKNSDREFAALVNECRYMVVCDSFALHVALALKKKTIGLFFCTSPAEIEGYGLLTKIVSKKLGDFFPKRMDEYNEELTKSITADEVMNAVEEIKNKNK